jgi:hypothetical protein
MITFSTSAIVKTKASPARPCVLLKRQMGRVEEYLHPAGMYISNMQKSAACNNNKDRAIAEEPFPFGGTDLRIRRLLSKVEHFRHPDCTDVLWREHFPGLRPDRVPREIVLALPSSSERTPSESAIRKTRRAGASMGFVGAAA